MVLTLRIGLLFLGQWQDNCKVTNSTARIVQESDFCHKCKNVAKMRQEQQGAVGLYQEIETFQWNNCASFYVIVTVIQIMSMT